jgi:hypothetical protein
MNYKEKKNRNLGIIPCLLAIFDFRNKKKFRMKGSKKGLKQSLYTMLDYLPVSITTTCCYLYCFFLGKCSAGLSDFTEFSKMTESPG